MAAGEYSPAWDQAGLEGRCREMRDAILETGLALPGECDDYAPEGAQNPEEGLGAWIWYYFSLGRMWGRGEKGAPVNPVAEAAALAAIKEEPVAVPLVALRDDGRPQELRVYPKSVDALFWVDDLDQFIGRLAVGREQLRRAGNVEAAEHLPKVTAELAYQLGLLAWALTTEGCMLPPEVESAAESPPLPEHIRHLDAIDYHHIRRAHLQVNGTRLALIFELAGGGEKGGSRHNWATLASVAAPKLGVDRAKRLLRDWSLAGWVGQLFLASSAEREAREMAEVSHGR